MWSLYKHLSNPSRSCSTLGLVRSHVSLILHDPGTVLGSCPAFFVPLRSHRRFACGCVRVSVCVHPVFTYNTRLHVNGTLLYQPGLFLGFTLWAWEPGCTASLRPSQRQKPSALSPTLSHCSSRRFWVAGRWAVRAGCRVCTSGFPTHTDCVPQCFLVDSPASPWAGRRNPMGSRTGALLAWIAAGRRRASLCQQGWEGRGHGSFGDARVAGDLLTILRGQREGLRLEGQVGSLGTAGERKPRPSSGPAPTPLATSSLGLFSEAAVPATGCPPAPAHPGLLPSPCSAECSECQAGPSHADHSRC
jgi:hypothetical protein